MMSLQIITRWWNVVNKLEGLANITKYGPKKYMQYVNVCETIMIEYHHLAKINAHA